MTHSRVLIVEDSVLIALAMADDVMSLGHEVIGPANSLRTGLARAIEGDFQFALLDFDLGAGETSAPIARSLLAQGIAFAFVSGTNPALICEEFAQSQIFEKPIGRQQLQKLLAN